MSRPVRVAHVTTVDLSLRFLLLDQLRRLRDEGFEVVTISAPGPWTGELTAEGIRHIAWPHATRAWNPRADVRAFGELVRIFRRERFDIVHTHNPKPGIMGRLAAKLTGVPHVVNTVHGLYVSPDDRVRRKVPVLLAEWLVARASDAELYQSSEDLAWAKRLRIVTDGRAELLGNGVDVDRFSPAPLDAGARRALRASFGLPEHSLVVGMVARLVAEKGCRELFEAAARIRTVMPGVRFLVVGDPDRSKLDAIAEAEIARVADNVVFAGWQPNVRDLLAAVDVFVLPSWREGMPRSAIEAAAVGLPLVLTDIRGCREVARHGVEGLLVPPRDATALTGALLAVLSDQRLRERLGAAARARAVERFDGQRVADTVVSTYRRLLARDPGLPRSGGRSGNGNGASRTVRSGASMTSSNPMRPGGTKRVLDLVIASIALVVTAPLTVVIALLVLVRLGPPVLFRQRRPGLNGRPFTIMKFRSLTDARDGSGRLLPDQERVTRIGRALRRSSLDELPELFNVIRGEMSIVGPRPLLMEYLPRYSAEQMRRHEVKPGITGWAQVNGRNSIDWPRKFELDVWYVDNRSLLLDCKILGLTVGQIFRRADVSSPGRVSAEEFTGEKADVQGAGSMRGGQV